MNNRTTEQNICGIYKITSPSGRVYIGESGDIYKRWKGYERINTVKRQPKLYKSFKKYGIENHIFEIVEECEFEELLCRERYYQDLCDVLNGGLNLRLTECEEIKGRLSKETTNKMRISKLGELNPMYKPDKIVINKVEEDKTVVCLTTGIFYLSPSEASTAYNIKLGYLLAMLRGSFKNNTSLIYAKNYVDGIELPKTSKYKRIWTKKTVDITTNIVYESPKEVSEVFNITLATLYSKLSGHRINNTNFKYL